MAINATSESTGNQSLVPSGTHLARCYQMIEIGTVTSQYMGEEKVQKKVRIGFELPMETKEFKEGEGQKPFVISSEFTLSMYDKSTLRKYLESWRGKTFTDDEASKFDITKLIGVPCMVTVTHTEKNGKTYSNIKGLSGVPKGMTIPNQVNPNFVLSYDTFDFEKFNVLPDFIKVKMKETPEYMNLTGVMETKHEQASTEVNDDLPF